ncbi:amino acid ABC transporter substrate-binding protein [Achromobacter sp. ACM04]|jgi:branched-chain amino acid transport system substrate-binding protein|uniref:Amino acid ABC transporter substrate-binding protein n=1 Tax=Achromobacter aegrifaciens TaxID=1287736 RepID=A0AAD2J6A8_ACHAE|nr:MULTISPECIES: amino acid ABC transporter substrate-binding protein [Achromobacter]MBD9383293.1 amino acid ABC transporter substrate-binding protein [Achromobacter sp. ACM02]MBD9420812.1 amino acid ABC transporter substrate-binding protein [Achromobacter sp. ACM04]MBD9430345.1 amino acid ABC transporter substrate-binding protein [Achromobacter sp. ACM03]MBD9471879.1 amino acid ABC transporter substrate-binding protein [Achromobacter sp. ACM01]MDQ1760870.1 amino acid ABC transporter substrate
MHARPWLSRIPALALAVAALTPALGAAQTSDKIRVGMTVSSTGSFALASQSGVRGVELWVDDVNRRGGIEVKGKKYPVELVKLDDRSDKQMVTRVYERLIVDEKVDLVFAPFGSTLTAAAATVTERLGKYMMVWSAASDDLYKQGFKNMVSGTQMPVSAMLRANMELAAKQGVKKVALLYSDEPFPAGLAEGGKEQAAKNGMEVVLFEKYPKGQKDFSTILQKARAAGAEALVPTSYEGDLISMTRQMKQLDINFPYVFMVYASTPQFQAIGADSNYIYSHTNYHPAINWKVNAGLTREQFAAAYDQRFPKAEFPPDFQTALAYGAGALTEEIVKQAGSTDAAALKKASLDLSGKLTVMAGPYAIDETGKQLLMPFPVVQLLPGKGMVPVWPADVATQKPVYPAPDWNKR